ncbi:MAG: YbjN domain-containing protein [Actinomycetota bacterium]
MTDSARSSVQLDELETRIDTWLSAQLDENPTYLAVDRGEPDERRWYVRLRGEAKDITTIWLTLRQRMLHYETYVMPAPEENERELFEQLLRRNDTLVGAHFSIGAEDAIFLRGALPLLGFDEEELDRVVGSVYAFVEQSFGSAIRLGFARRFRDA